jgi:hypothetical protein
MRAAQQSVLRTSGTVNNQKLKLLLLSLLSLLSLSSKIWFPLLSVFHIICGMHGILKLFEHIELANTVILQALISKRSYLRTACANWSSCTVKIDE